MLVLGSLQRPNLHVVQRRLVTVFAAHAEDEAGFLHVKIGSRGLEGFLAGDMGDHFVALAFQEQGVGGGGVKVGFGGGMGLGFGLGIGLVVVLDEGPALRGDDDGEEVAFFLQLTGGGIVAQVDDAHGAELEVHLHGAVLQGQTMTKGTDVLVTGFLGSVELAFDNAEAARVGMPALGHCRAGKGFLQQKRAFFSQGGLDVGSEGRQGDGSEGEKEDA